MERELFPFDVAPALLTEFISTFQSYTEAPDEFLGAIPIYVAEVIAGRCIHFNGQFLNNYLLIVGATGLVKKSTALSLSTKLLIAVKELNPLLQISRSSPSADEKEPDGPKSAYPLVTHFSVEGLQSHAIGEGTSTAILIGEYGSVFEVGKRQGQQNTISELTNMYDGQLIDVKTISRKVKAENFSLSILAASTENWLSEFCSGKNIGGGFVNRHLIFSGKSMRILPMQVFPPALHWNLLVEQFSKLVPPSIRSVIEDGTIKWRGDVQNLTWSIDAEGAWTKFYRSRTLQIRQLESTFLAEISAREFTHSIKIAGLACFLDSRKEVSLKDLEFGMRLTRWSIQNAILLVNEKSQPQMRDANTKRVLDKLTKSGGMSKTDLARALGGQQKGINNAIRHLLIEEILEDCPDGLLRIYGAPSNSQTFETDKYFGKLDASVFDGTKKLEVGCGIPDSGYNSEVRRTL